MADILASDVCTAKWTTDGAAGSCKTAGSCCVGIALTASQSTAIASSKTICVPADTAVTKAITLTADQNTAAAAGNVNVFSIAACPVYTAGASTLAVSAAALATAVYMM